MPAKSALILAGAGSGKTRVLTTRIAYIIEEQLASPMQILAVTFTNKAAKEMLTRITASIALNPRGMWVGTFHGLCNRLLRTHYNEVGLPQTFQILDTSDQLSAIKRLMKLHHINDELFPAKDIQRFISNAKEEGLRAQDMASEVGEKKKLVEIYALYEEQCNREGVADFGELLLRSYELLARNSLIRHHYQERFRFILVDEFQDTNRLQYKWLKLLGGFDALGRREYTGNCVFAVGDDDQSIYAFRGANVGNMKDFVRDFEVDEVVKLEQNYRSFGHILNAANELIANNSERMGKDLWTDAGDGEKIKVFRADDDRMEAAYCLSTIREAVARGTKRHEIAILYRSNAQSRVIEQSLIAGGVPYKVYGGLRFFDRAEIKNALAYLRLIENPKDDTAFLRVVNFPLRGIGAKTMEALQTIANDRRISLYEASLSVQGSAATKLRGFTDLIDAMRQEYSSLPLHDMIEAVIERTGIVDHYKKDREGADRLENLEELQSAARAYLIEEGIAVDAMAATLEPEANEDEMSALAGFLSHAALEAGDNQAQSGEDAVQLMTVHAAKGLEFDLVFITGVEEGLFPHSNSYNDSLGLAEERRLMYVAITRARKELHMSFSLCRMLRGQYMDSGPSQFLDEIDDSHLNRLYEPRSDRIPNYEDFDQSQSWGEYSKPQGGSRRGWDGTYGNAYGSSYGRSSGGSYNSYGSARGQRWGYSKKSTDTFYERGSVRSSMRAKTSFAQAKQMDPAAKKMMKTTVMGLSVGDRVFHPKFGEGVVRSLLGVDDDARVRIDFDDVGMKELMLSLAKLTKR